MRHSPVSLFLRTVGNGRVWYARFWDYEAKRYAVTRSTGIIYSATSKVRNRDLALKTATAMAEKTLEDAKREARALEEAATAAAAKALEEAAKAAAKALEEATPLLLDYVQAFWRNDSAYVRGKRQDKTPLSAEYLKNNAKALENHLLPYEPLAAVRLHTLKAGVLLDWKLWALENGRSPRTVNVVLQAVRVAVRHAVERGDLDADPLARVKAARYAPAVKGVLLPSEIKRLLAVDEADLRVRAAVLLALLCGLRRGEARGLQWSDVNLAENILDVRHNWIDEEGRKPCKWGSSRRVPLPGIVAEALKALHAQAAWDGPEAFLLFDVSSPDRPITETVLKRGFWRMLKAIGLDRTACTARNLTFHGLRHAFITYARSSGLNDATVQAFAGHSSPRMMATYSHVGEIIDFAAAKATMDAARERINGALDKAAGGVS